MAINLEDAARRAAMRRGRPARAQERVVTVKARCSEEAFRKLEAYAARLSEKKGVPVRPEDALIDLILALP